MKQKKKTKLNYYFFESESGKRIVLVLFLLFVFLLPLFQARAGDDSEDKIDDTKSAIKKLEKKKKKKEAVKQKYVQEANAVRSHINRLSGSIYSLNKQVSRLEEELNQCQENINRTEAEIQKKKQRLAGLLRELSAYQKEMSLIVLDKRKGLNTYIRLRREVERLQSELIDSLNELKAEKENLQKEKENKKALKEQLLEKKSSLEGEKRQKTLVLQSANQKIADQDKEIKAIERKINHLRATLSSFLGKSFDAKDIVEAVRFASKKTGVRKEFLMAMLDKESDLGRFTGGCTYKNTKMRSSEKELFKKICKELGYNYKKKKISCALSYGYGGAMGVAQFMPSTWMGYKSIIARHTGHNPPDPWDLTDGVMAMAEKLKRAGADRKKGEHYAAKVYYCGSPRSKYWNTHCEAYADTVVSWAKGGYDEYF